MNQYLKALKRAAQRERTHYIRQKQRVERFYRTHPENLGIITGIRLGEVVRSTEIIDISKRYGACWWEYSEIGGVTDERTYHLRYNEDARSARDLRQEAKESFAWLLLADDVVPEPAGRALYSAQVVANRVIHRHEADAEQIWKRIVRSDVEHAVY